jgi:hypothetical protein
VKLPGLPPIQQPKAILIDFDLVQIHDTGCADILLDPGVFDRLRADPVESLSQIAERPAGLLLDFENVLDLNVAEHALFDEKLSDSDSWQMSLLAKVWPFDLSVERHGDLGSRPDLSDRIG